MTEEGASYFAKKGKKNSNRFSNKCPPSRLVSLCTFPVLSGEILAREASGFKVLQWVASEAYAALVARIGPKKTTEEKEALEETEETPMQIYEGLTDIDSLIDTKRCAPVPRPCNERKDPPQQQ